MHTKCSQASYYLSNQLRNQIYKKYASNNIQRSMDSNTDPAKSVISGNGTSSVVAFQAYRVTVTAKDSTGIDIGHGGDMFYIRISNECTPNSDFTWTEVLGARQVLSSPIMTTMIDNRDGTYYYDYSVQLDGTITMLIALKQNGAYSTWYDNNSWSGSPSVYNVSSTIDYNWGSGLITPTRSDLVTVVFSFFITVPISDAYTFYTTSDDDWSLYVDGVPKLNNYSGNQRTQQTTINLVQNQLYHFIIKYREVYELAYIRFYWSNSAFTKTIVPYTSMYWLVYVNSFPITVSSSCPAGYSGSIAIGQTKCSEVWGDSIRAGLEQCDDGNTSNSDGWNSVCKIENNWVWSNNNTAHRDVCTKWAIGYEPNSTKDAWITKETSQDIQKISYSIAALILIWFVWNIVCSIWSNSSFQSSLAMINSIQLLLLLPLIGSYLPQNVIQFIWAMKFSLLNFDFLSKLKVNYVRNLIDFDQSNSSLNLIGLESGSSGVNAYFIAGFSLQLF